MNYFPKLAFFLLAASGSAHQVIQDKSLNVNVEEMANLELSVELMAKFHEWVGEHEKSYGSPQETMDRLKIWIANNGAY